MTSRAGRPLRLAVDGRVLDDRYHGIGRITEAALREMAKRADVHVTLFVSRHQKSTRFSVDELIESSGFIRAQFDLPLTSPRQFVAWPSALKRVGAEAALFPYHLGASVLGGRGVSRSSIVHDCILEASPEFAPDNRTRLLYKTLTRVVVRRTTIVTPSHASANEIRRNYGVVVDGGVVPWGVDPSFARPASPIGEVNGVMLPKHYYLHVGARRPHKNVETLVRALPHMPATENLVLVGSADERWPDPLPKLIRSCGVTGRVIRLSGVSESDLLRVYAGAKAFLYPSLVEGFGLPLLEAMAARLPVVASNIPVFREVAGDAALFAPPLDPEAWATSVKLLDDAACRQSIVDAGTNRARNATWESAVDLLLEALLQARRRL